jgi:hypothetical protein
LAQDLLIKGKSGVFAMHISQQIDQLIASLSALKPILSANPQSNTDQFNNILNASIESSAALSSETQMQVNSNTVTGAPNWVDRNYGYDQSEPRKPNMREMMEALSGKSVEELYAEEQTDWRKQSELASDLLYGVVGEKADTRDWTTIMNSEDILTETRHATNKMHQPIVDIASEFDRNNQLINQYAVIKSSSGEVLKSLTGETEKVQNIIENFALKSGSVPVDLEDRITLMDFDRSIFKLLKNLPEPQNVSIKTDITETLEALTIKSQLSSINPVQSEIIPLEEMNKL